MEEIRIREGQLDELSEEVKCLLDGLEKSGRRAQDIDDLEERFHTYENTLDAMQMELKSLSPNDKKNWKKKFRQYKKQLKEMKNDFEWKKSNKVRDDLIGDHEEDKADLNTADGLMNHGRTILDEGKKALERAQQNVAKTTEIAKKTAEKLADQQRQLEKIFDDIKSIDSTLARSTRIIKRIGRKIATDKYLWVIIFIVIFFIIFIIVWKATGHGGSVNTPNVPTT